MVDQCQTQADGVVEIEQSKWVPVYEISLLPKAKAAGRTKRRAQRADALTSSPYKKQLISKSKPHLKEAKKTDKKKKKEDKATYNYCVF